MHTSKVGRGHARRRGARPECENRAFKSKECMLQITRGRNLFSKRATPAAYSYTVTALCGKAARCRPITKSPLLRSRVVRCCLRSKLSSLRVPSNIITGLRLYRRPEHSATQTSYNQQAAATGQARLQILKVQLSHLCRPRRRPPVDLSISPRIFPPPPRPRAQNTLKTTF